MGQGDEAKSAGRSPWLKTTTLVELGHRKPGMAAGAGFEGPA